MKVTDNVSMFQHQRPTVNKEITNNMQAEKTKFHKTVTYYKSEEEESTINNNND